MLKTKIVCTLGPATEDPAILESLVVNGMDVARLNFSHGTHESHLKCVESLRAICDRLDRHVPVMLDTKGPEIRLGVFPDGDIRLEDGQSYTLTTLDVPCDQNRASVSYTQLHKDLTPGDFVLIDDGLVRLEVKEIVQQDIRCIARNGGMLSSRKSINLPGVRVNLPSFTEHDRRDILFAIEHNFDFIAVSFVRKKNDIIRVRRLLEENNCPWMKLIAKIESREGVSNLDDIIRVADGIMVARGDLGVEIPVAEIPVVQKDMIRRCYRAGKPVITATQMLDSMIRNPRPTRAEVTDVANAIYDGTSATMLSGETASGKYPIQALQTMCSIAETTEHSIDYWKNLREYEPGSYNTITNAIGHATCTTAMDLRASAIVAVTTSGSIARRISSFRPGCPVVAATTSKKALHQLKLSWGVYPVLVDVVTSTDDLFAAAAEGAQRTGLVCQGDLIVVTAGVPLGMRGTTNMLKVQLVGDILCRGVGIGAGKANGSVYIVQHAAAEQVPIRRGSVLVIDEISDDVLPLIRGCSAVILDGEDKDDMASTLSRAMDIPFIVQCDGAMRVLKSGTFVCVDAVQGTVRQLEQ